MGLNINLKSSESIPCPQQCELCGGKGYVLVTDRDDYGGVNMTHNFASFAKEAGIYYALWRPGNVNIDKAKDLIPHLEYGLAAIALDPGVYVQYEFHPVYGNLATFRKYIEELLRLCEEHPEAYLDVGA